MKENNAAGVVAPVQQKGKKVRDYQRKKTKYILPAAVYHKTLWTIRDYHRIKDELSTMITPNGSRNGERTDHCC